MEPIRVRNPRGEELTFTDPAELGRAVAQGTITPEWTVYESASGEWSRVSGSEGGVIAEPTSAVARRSREVVLIFSPEEAAPTRSSGPETGPDPLDLVSILTPDEIDRVLGRRPRLSGPDASGGASEPAAL
jgi:hypothetical protein